MATEIQIPRSTISQTYQDAHLTSAATEPILRDDFNIAAGASKTTPSQQFHPQRNPFLASAHCTVFDFPSFEPTSVATYPSTHLLVPMRKDILHRAVVYEGDATRQGTANTKWRAEVHGSGRKIRPQKGTGMARLGDKKSPMLRGGGVAFGPKPRDFATGLPRRVYDFAWRIALSYRYRQGELMLLDNEASLDHVPRESRERYLRELLVHNHLSNASGRTLFVTLQRQESLYETLEAGSMGKHALAKDVDDVDVKDLLELGRIVVEKRALHEIFMRHQSDLDSRLRLSGRGDAAEAIGGQAAIA